MTEARAQAGAIGAPPGTVLRTLAQRVDAERVRMLYAAAPFSILIHLLCASVLGYALCEVMQASAMTFFAFVGMPDGKAVGA